jgi:hypothetical protein
LTRSGSLGIDGKKVFTHKTIKEEGKEGKRGNKIREGFFKLRF